MSRTKRPSIHPGEILLAEFLGPMNISQYRLAKDINVPPRRINEIVRGMRAITVDTALRLARYFGTSERFWLNLQAHYDLEVEKDRLGDRLQREVKVRASTGSFGAQDKPRPRV
jgi:addiction module HigA family antidote